MKSYRRDRCTLHKTHLEDFRAWLKTWENAKGQYWKVGERADSRDYEVLRAELVSKSGSYGHSFIYQNNHNDHLTVQADLVPMVKRWLKERKSNEHG